MQIEEIKKLFIAAQNHDLAANHDLGVYFYWGINNFPKDPIQAKKHFLRAVLFGKHTAGNVYFCHFCLSFIKKIDMEASTNTFIPWQDVNEIPYYLSYDSKQDLQLYLDEIEAKHGEFSQFEIELCKPSVKSLKDIGLKYVSSHLSFFKDIQKRLPADLLEALEFPQPK